MRHKKEHEVSDRLDELQNKAATLFVVRGYQIKGLARLKVYLKVWSAVRNLAEYGDQKLGVAAQDLFSGRRSKVGVVACSERLPPLLKAYRIVSAYLFPFFSFPF